MTDLGPLPMDDFENRLAQTDSPGPGGLMWPDTCHPYYREHRRFLLGWLEDAANDQVRVAKPRRVRMSDLTSLDPVGAGPEVITLHRHRATGLAPYVGRPFVYRWFSLVDGMGRGIAGEARIEYLPDRPA